MFLLFIINIAETPSSRPLDSRPVFFHYRPNKAKEFPLITKIIHVADSIVDQMNLGSSGEAIANPVSQEILNELGFGELPVEKFESQIKDQYYSAMSVFL